MGNNQPTKLQEVFNIVLIFCLMASIGFNIYQSRYFGGKLEDNASDVKRMYDSMKSMEDTIQSRVIRKMDSLMNGVQKREKRISNNQKKRKDENDLIHNADSSQLDSIIKSAGLNPVLR